jgi:hypothetical protein
MFKKIFLGGLFVVLVGVLVWGGVNRTVAKSGDEGEGRRNQNQLVQNDESESVGFSRGGKWSSEAEDADQPHSGGVSYGLEKEECDEEHTKPAVQTRNMTAEDQQGNGYRGGMASGNVVQINTGSGRGRQGQGGGLQPLSENELETLQLALDDEYHALAVYLSVMDTFGDVEPFKSIAESERRHIDALVMQFNKYGLQVPENEWTGNIPDFESLSQACTAAVDAELSNAELYERLFSMTDRQDLIRVFTNLSRASMESHLPEFEACQ